VTTTAESQAYLDAIVYGTPEDTASIWFMNAHPAVQQSAFIKLEMEITRLRAENAELRRQAALTEIARITQEDGLYE